MLSDKKKQEQDNHSDNHLKVYLNVYDLQQNTSSFTHTLGLGTYHSGLVIRNTEYTFSSDSGVFHHSPKQVNNLKFIEEIYLGKTDIDSIQELNKIINELKQEFTPNSYHPINKNCNHFANELCKRLLNGKTIPNWVNRTASIGSFFSKFIPTATTDKLIEKQKEEQINKELNKEKHLNTNLEFNLNQLINFKELYCLNQNDKYPIKNIFENNNKYLESDMDEQLIIYIPFQCPVNITSFNLKMKDKQSCPKSFKCFVNSNVKIDFENVENIKVVDEIEIDEEEANSKEGMNISLKVVKFRNVNYLVIFINDNYGNEKTRIYNLTIIGTPIMNSGMDLNKLQQVNSCCNK
ncbi:hypothetical protein ABK040_014679 [Willaertia magna]